MNRLSRRNLLLSLPACTLLPPFQPRPAHRPTPRGWHRCLAHARERVTQELRVFKTLIAPLVVRSHYRDEGGRWRCAPDYQRLRSYQLVTDALSNALLVREIPADIEVQPAMQEARDYVSEIDSCVALNGREPGLAKRCRVDR